MSLTRCAVCGQPFEAKRSDAKFCSNKCRQKAKRIRKRPRPVWTCPPEPPKPVAKDVEATFNDAHRVANDLGRLSVNGPYQLRGACARISAAIQAALEAENL